MKWPFPKIRTKHWPKKKVKVCLKYFFDLLFWINIYVFFCVLFIWLWIWNFPPKKSWSYLKRRNKKSAKIRATHKEAGVIQRVPGPFIQQHNNRRRHVPHQQGTHIQRPVQKFHSLLSLQKPRTDHTLLCLLLPNGRQTHKLGVQTNWQDNYERFMASKELKKRNWLFNKKHLVWLKLHEKLDREQNYLVFDRKEWRVKKTSNFEFDESLIVHDM